jgi:hypothetical protein
MRSVKRTCLICLALVLIFGACAKTADAPSHWRPSSFEESVTAIPDSVSADSTQVLAKKSPNPLAVLFGVAVFTGFCVSIFLLPGASGVY